MAKKKILYVATVDSHIIAFHLPYLKMMHDKGWEVHVATNGKEKIPYCDKKHTICMERSPYKLNNLKAIKQMKRLLEKEHFDIIHCHTPMGSVVTRLAAKKARKNGTRVIYTAHGFHFYTGAPLISWLLFYPVEWYLAKYTDTLITINNEDYNLAVDNFKKRCKDIKYMNGVGVDIGVFNKYGKKTNREKIKKGKNISRKNFTITCIGRLDKNKNQKFLINTANEIIKTTGTDTKILLVGQDELCGYYQKVVKKKRLQDNIIFLGNRNDIPEILNISDVVVSTSKREGLPISIIESLASGKPIVALKCRGVDDIIQDEENGYIIKSREELIESIRKLYSDRKLCKTISANNIKKSKQYSINEAIRIVKKIYEDK